MWNSFQHQYQRRMDRFDPANRTIWAECIKNSEPMDTSEPMEPFNSPPPPPFCFPTTTYRSL